MCPLYIQLPTILIYLAPQSEPERNTAVRPSVFNALHHTKTKYPKSSWSFLQPMFRPSEDTKLPAAPGVLYVKKKSSMQAHS
jgi:hypothetical protein